MNPPTLFDHSLEELTERVQAWELPAYRARQLLQWAYRGVEGYDQMSDLPHDLRARLPDLAPLSSLAVTATADSADGKTVKRLFRLADGALVEAVRMQAGSDKQRITICVSSQAGCAYGCRFCATGQAGYGRNLSSGEMVEQVVHFTRAAAGIARNVPARHADEKGRVTNVVFMGMGEPFANYEAVQKAVVTLNAPWGLGLAARRITVSTVGLVPEVRRFAREPLQANLAVSLHAANDALRDSLMPVNRKYPLRVLMTACRDYVERTNRRISFEYILLADVNDSVEQARELAALVKDLLCHVNVIPANPTDGGEFRRPAPERQRAFLHELQRRGIPATIRQTQGVDIQAACGQLKTEGQAKASIGNALV